MADRTDNLRLFPVPPMLLRLDAVLARSGYSESGLYEAMARGEFPRTRKRGATLLWVDAEVRAWERGHHRPSSTADQLPTACSHTKADQPTCLYRHRDGAGRLLYVGIALSPVARLQGHRDAAPWFREIARIDVEWFPTRLEAHHAEVAAIRTEHPIHNIAHVVAA